MQGALAKGGISFKEDERKVAKTENLCSFHNHLCPTVEQFLKSVTTSNSHSPQNAISDEDEKMMIGYDGYRRNCDLTLEKYFGGFAPSCHHEEEDFWQGNEWINSK